MKFTDPTGLSTLWSDEYRNALNEDEGYTYSSEDERKWDSGDYTAEECESTWDDDTPDFRRPGSITEFDRTLDNLWRNGIRINTNSYEYTYGSRFQNMSSQSILLQMLREADIYKKGGGGKYGYHPTDEKGNSLPTDTWCNQALYDFLVLNSPDLLKALTGSTNRAVGDRVSASQAIQNIRDSKEVIRISAGQAQILANMGYNPVAAGNGHLAAVVPSDCFDSTLGPLVSNVGEKNGIYNVHTREAFGRSAKVEYYYVQRKN